MPRPARQPRRPLIGRTGAWLVVFAISLIALGVVLAIQQSERLSSLLTLQARNIAIEIANKSRAEVTMDLETLFEAAHSESAGMGDGSAPGAAVRPPWVKALYEWNRGKLLLRLGRTDPPRELEAVVSERLIALQLLADVETPVRTQLVTDAQSGAAYLIAIETARRPAEAPGTLVAWLDDHRLVREIVEPLLVYGLELVPANQPNLAPWVQPISLGGVREGTALWELRPTVEYLAEQTAAVRWNTWFHLTLTGVALITLLIAMVILLRVTRREIALAEMKANFVADVSHELKTPLAVLRLYGETLQSGRVKDEAKRQEYYAIITRESARLTNMINNILDFARIEAGRGEYRFKPTDVGQVVEETFEAYRPELDRAGFQHQLRIEPALPFVNADRDAIVQILFNLLSNATKYSDEEKFVEVDVKRDTRRGKHGIAIAVSDRGIGISPEDRLRLFEGFYRSPDDRVRRRSGAGLGLALVKHIVDAHHGSIDVEGRLVRGTTFRIFLPASEVSAGAEPTASSSGSPISAPAEGSGSGVLQPADNTAG
ncbi:MAG: HAMP domain-containing histidine kinase [Phycisphaerae bacterium]|nr:HAMP domain-containing histidine kinase [Phycisphaerae bacterium]